ncbi:MAG: bifunctional [glutamine synthetase] adenylyltransferase/[glutamine synthetase]-adenylyl-L-tyrosine phosphorylase [Acidimicrobiia bacterium]
MNERGAKSTSGAAGSQDATVARATALLGPARSEALARLEPVLAAVAPASLTGDTLARLCAIASVSRALPATLANHPELIIPGTGEDHSLALQQRQALFQIAGDEVRGTIDLSEAMHRYSTFIDKLVGETLKSARERVAAQHPAAAEIEFAVIAMGKWGAQELNYYSDIDLLFVHGEHPADPEAGRSAALALASRLMATLSDSTFDGPGLIIDADLRPEGTMGPLTRRMEAYERYYEQWAEPWELQALIKARPAAGSTELGQQFGAIASRFVWEQGLDVEALRGLRRIKAMTEERANPEDIKRAPGGIRDIEFTVQMLQLVHGRHDPTVRERSTLGALTALETGEFITGEERSELEEGYRFLRRLEHQIQLWDLRQTHRFPGAEEDRSRLASNLGMTDADDLTARLRTTRSQARTLHERIYFRPVLESLVGSPSARLGPDRAGERLVALGFGNARESGQALEELTKGLSRRSRAMQQMMPLMLDWLSLAPDPDLGLSQLRLLLAHTPDHSSMVALLLNSPTTGERLAMLLGTGQLLGNLIDRIPESIPRLGSDEALDHIRDRDEAASRLLGLLASRPDFDDRIGTIRRFARRRRLRIAARDILRHPPITKTIEALSVTADAAMIGALEVAAPEQRFAVIAMGRWGGGELSYGSDLDLMYVYEGMVREEALAIPGRLRQILSDPGKHGEGYELDAGLRPEGKSGPIARSVESLSRYYDEWAEPWEILALTRARAVAGHPDVIRAFYDTINPVLWREKIEPEVIQSIRKIKARVETERIDPEEDADFHIKLGPGSLSDIEFVTQLLQLKHGAANPHLRTTVTPKALGALLEMGVIHQSDYNTLITSYEFCTEVRLRLHLQRGRFADSLPSDPAQLSKLASSLGYDRTVELRERFQQVTRRARRVFERLFYE